MANRNCLNCEKELLDAYCSGCGQKADTHRISLKNFIFHDLLHGTFHFEKGMWFTARQALTRPGKAALDYISGKRIRYYNVFYLTLITFGSILFLRYLNDQLDLMLGREIVPDSPYINEASKTMDTLISQKSKLIIFLFVPFAALDSFILFRRKRLNLSEHAIVSGMVLLGILLISALGNLFFYVDLIVPFNDTFASVMSNLITVLAILYIGYGYVNAFGGDYSKWGIAYRTLLFFALLGLQIVVLFMVVWGYISNWQYGEISISPFD